MLNIIHKEPCSTPYGLDLYVLMAVLKEQAAYFQLLNLVWLMFICFLGMFGTAVCYQLWSAAVGGRYGNLIPWCCFETLCVPLSLGHSGDVLETWVQPPLWVISMLS